MLAMFVCGAVFGAIRDQNKESAWHAVGRSARQQEAVRKSAFTPQRITLLLVGLVVEFVLSRGQYHWVNDALAPDHARLPAGSGGNVLSLDRDCHSKLIHLDPIAPVLGQSL